MTTVTADAELSIVARPLVELIPYPENPRKMPGSAVSVVASSLLQFGWQQPIVIDPDGVIVAGHTRRAAAMSLGWTTAPTVTIAADRARAYRLVDNRSAEFTSWDLDLLRGEMTALTDGLLSDGLKIDLEPLDFDTLMPAEPVEGKTDPDDVPDAPPARTKPGDVWTLGKHRLLCGDASSAADMDVLLDGARPRLAVTSPPYNLRNTIGGSFPPRGGSWPNAKIKTGYATHADNMPHAEYVAWQRLCLDLMLRHVEDSGAVYYNHKWRVQAGLLQDRADIMRGFPLRQIIVWDRGGVSTNFSDSFFLQTFEVIYLIARPSFRLAPKASHAGAVWRIGFDAPSEHPAPYPVALVDRCIRSVECGAVLDPFVGSGTTLIAAERLGRTCYAMEIAPEYCDMAVARWEAYTGKTATLVPAEE